MSEIYSLTAILVYTAWIIISGFIFFNKPINKAIIYHVILSSLFLPIISISFLGVPDLNKEYFINITLFMFCILSKLRGKSGKTKFNLGLFDFIVIFYLFSYLPTAYLNNLGIWEGLSASYNRITLIGLPYFVGRLYLSDCTTHKDLSYSIFLLCLAYLPFCIYELRFSPQLHNIIYGYSQHSFAQSVREGVWRPMVFMRHGLEVSLWLSFSSLIGFWLYKTKLIKSGLHLISILIMGGITIICQSYGSIMLMIIGGVCLIMSFYFKKGLPIILLFIFPSFYLINRVAELKIERKVVESARKILPLRRLRSVNFRLDQEDAIIKKANEKMIYGWGRIDGARVYDYSNRLEIKTKSITDSRWIIEYGNGGLISLIPYFLIFTFPAIGLYKMAPPSLWHTKNFAPTAVLAIGTGSALNDILLNDFCSTLHYLIIGALSYPIYNSTKYSLIQIVKNEEVKP